MSADKTVVDIAGFRGREAQLTRERGNLITARFRKTVPDRCTIHVLREVPPAGTDKD